jgi:hypothetical protein
LRGLMRPEGNVTGFTISFGSLGGVELLKEVALHITVVES